MASKLVLAARYRFGSLDSCTDRALLCDGEDAGGWRQAVCARVWEGVRKTVNYLARRKNSSYLPCTDEKWDDIGS